MSSNNNNIIDAYYKQKIVIIKENIPKKIPMEMQKSLQDLTRKNDLEIYKKYYEDSAAFSRILNRSFSQLLKIKLSNLKKQNESFEKAK